MTGNGDTRGSVVVVGAGIVGVCCAAFLQRAGREVTLVDRLAPGEATSFGNAGSLSWSSCVPIAVPGLLPKIPGWLLRPNGPLTIRWRHLPRLAPWLWQWVRAGQTRPLEEVAASMAALHGPSLDLHRELAQAAGATDLVRGCGYLHLFRKHEPDRLADDEWRLREKHGARLELLDADDIRALEPALGPHYPQAVLIHDQGYAANPSRLVKAYAARFASDGGRILEAEVSGFDANGGRVRAVRTTAGPLPAESVVIAAGAWSTRLTRMLGFDLPLEAERGYHVTLAEPGVSIRHTIMETEAKFMVTPMEMGLRFAGTVELATVDAPPDYRRADAILATARWMFPDLRTEPASRWMGQRPSLPDGLPAIGRAPRHENVYLAFGHAHTGMVGAPNTGRIVAGMVCSRPVNFDVSAFSPARFG